MKCLQYLCLIGQFCEIAGAYFLFRYSVPPHINKLSGTWIGGRTDVTKELADNKRYENLTKLGFGLILLGFLLVIPISIYNCFCN